MEPLKFFNEYLGDLMYAEFHLPIKVGCRNYIFNHSKSMAMFATKWLGIQQTLVKKMEGVRLEA